MYDIDKLILAIKELNERNWLDWIQLIANIIFPILTFWVAYLTFNLQKQIKKDEDREKLVEKVKHASNIYYFINDILNKMADIHFEYSAFNNIVIDGNDFMSDISYLKGRLFTNREFSLLRELYALYDGIKQDPRENEKNFKILYKKLIDINLNPVSIPDYRNSNNLDYIVSLSVLSIIKKLELIMNGKIEMTDSRIEMNIDCDNNVYIKKNYGKGYDLEYNNEIINGKINKYEIVLFFKDDGISTVSELVYDGMVKDNVISGRGYYYYYTANGFGDKIDSGSLSQVGVNLDVIAQRIKKELSDVSPDGCFKATFVGDFKEGNINKGVLKYKLNLNDNDNEKEIK